MRVIRLTIIIAVLAGLIMGCGEKPTGGVTKEVLKNGLTVLVKEDHSSPVVSIVTWVKAGYFNEPDSLTGISHLLEHMYFKGTQRRGVGELARETKDAGGYLNAGTIYERTGYYTVLPSGSFEKGLDIQADALMHSAIDSSELAKESQVVIQEIKRKLDNPGSYSFEKLLELGFDKNRIRRWRMGYEDQVAGWSREDLIHYYRTRYRPENIVLSVVGDIDTGQAMELIKKYYGEFPEGEFQTEYSPAEPSQMEFKYRRLTGDISRNIVHIGFHVPGILDDDFYALTVLNYILSAGRASRFYQEIKEDQGLAQSIDSDYEAFKDFGYFTISAEQDNQDPLKLIEAVFDQLEKCRLDKVNREELTRAINQLESSYLHEFEEVNGQAQALAMFQAYGDYKLAFTYLDRLREVTADDIQKVAEKYFNLSNASVLEYLPEKSNYQAYTAADLKSKIETAEKEVADTLTQVSQESYSIPKTEGVGGEDLPNEVAQKTILDNGITVICRESHSLPLVSVAAYFYGGIFTENTDDAGITQLMAQTSMKGTKTSTASEIARRTEILGSNIGYSVENDYFGFTLESMSRNFEDGFKIFADVVLNPSFPEDELTKEKDDLKAAIKRQKDSMGSYPIELCLQALYEDEPYGLPSLGIEDAIDNITSDDLKVRHDRGVVTGNLVITFVGDITRDEAIQFVENYFAGMKQGSRYPSPPLDAELSSVHSKIEKRDRAQTAQAFAYLTCKYSDPDHEPLKVAQNILSGMGARLWTEVRDKRSLAYTVYAYQNAEALAGSFDCYLATSPDKALEARKLAMEVITGLEQNPPTDEEMQRSINYTAGSFSIYLQPNAIKADLYTRWELEGKGFKAVDEYPDKIRQVTREQVLDVAGRYFSTPYYGLGMVQGTGASVKQRE